MMKWFKRLFSKGDSFIGGGEGECLVVDSIGKTAARIWYRRPTSEEKLNFTYSLHNDLSQDNNLKLLEKSENKALTAHALMWRNVTTKYAEKVFIRATGFKADDVLIDDWSRERQWSFLEKYFAHVLSDLATIAYNTQGIVKKNT